MSEKVEQEKRMNGFAYIESDYSEFVEVDPTGRYGRYNEILGKGASKTVYRAFDEYEGIEVAWNQVKLFDFLQSPEDLERLYCEIHLLKTLKHENIMKFYTSWVDTAKRNINFVTEMFTSGTLRQYRQKHKRVNIRALKNWCRQILRGLLYLHSHDPPVIHRDLKCDNIFVNGNQGEVKIGDLGLAAVLRKSTAAHCVGTPEFMAPEVYEEEYNELIDIYSFGMCILEMVTFEYPYSECSHPAQIYKKVISGKKPDALYQVKDPEVREFIEKCLVNVSLRLSAEELLNDPFLQIEECETTLQPIECRRNLDYVDPVLRHPFPELDYKGNSFRNNSYNEDSNRVASDDQNGWGYQPTDIEQNGIDLFEYNDDEHEEHFEHVDITIKGKSREDGSIYLRLRISDKEDRIRNIYFSFDIEIDTALSVATEMVGELDITDQDVTKIADMIDGEIATLVPDWKPGPGIVETPRFANLCQNCASNHTSTGSFMHMQIMNCCGNGCASMHGRFEEYTFEVDIPQENGFHHQEYWNQHESVECSEIGTGDSNSAEEHENLDDKEVSLEEKFPASVKNLVRSLSGSNSDDYEQEIQKELRWLKAKYQMELRELRDQKHKTENGISSHFIVSPRQGDCKGNLVKSSDSGKRSSSVLHGRGRECCPIFVAQGVRKYGKIEKFPSADDRATPNGFHSQALIRKLVHRRTTSLPVDAVDDI